MEIYKSIDQNGYDSLEDGELEDEIINNPTIDSNTQSVPDIEMCDRLKVTIINHSNVGDRKRRVSVDDLSSPHSRKKLKSGDELYDTTRYNDLNSNAEFLSTNLSPVRKETWGDYSDDDNKNPSKMATVNNNGASKEYNNQTNSGYGQRNERLLKENNDHRMELSLNYESGNEGDKNDRMIKERSYNNNGIDKSKNYDNGRERNNAYENRRSGDVRKRESSMSRSKAADFDGCNDTKSEKLTEKDAREEEVEKQAWGDYDSEEEAIKPKENRLDNNNTVQSLKTTSNEGLSKHQNRSLAPENTSVAQEIKGGGYNDRRREISRTSDHRRESTKDDARSDKSRNSDSRREISKNYDSRRDSSRTSDSRRDKSRNYDSRRDSSRTSDRRRDKSRNYDGRRDKSRNYDSRRDSSRTSDSRRDKSRNYDSRRDSSRTSDRRRDKSRNYDGRRDKSRNYDGRRDSSRTSDSRRDKSRNYDGRRDSSRTSDSRRDRSSNYDGRRDRSRNYDDRREGSRISYKTRESTKDDARMERSKNSDCRSERSRNSDKISERRREFSRNSDNKSENHPNDKNNVTCSQKKELKHNTIETSVSQSLLEEVEKQAWVDYDSDVEVTKPFENKKNEGYGSEKPLRENSRDAYSNKWSNSHGSLGGNQNDEKRREIREHEKARVITNEDRNNRSCSKGKGNDDWRSNKNDVSVASGNFEEAEKEAWGDYDSDVEVKKPFENKKCDSYGSEKPLRENSSDASSNKWSNSHGSLGGNQNDEKRREIREHEKARVITNEDRNNRSCSKGKGNDDWRSNTNDVSVVSGNFEEAEKEAWGDYDSDVEVKKPFENKKCEGYGSEKRLRENSSDAYSNKWSNSHGSLGGNQNDEKRREIREHEKARVITNEDRNNRSCSKGKGNDDWRSNTNDVSVVSGNFEEAEKEAWGDYDSDVEVKKPFENKKCEGYGSEKPLRENSSDAYSNKWSNSHGSLGGNQNDEKRREIREHEKAGIITNEDRNNRSCSKGKGNDDCRSNTNNVSVVSGNSEEVVYKEAWGAYDSDDNTPKVSNYTDSSYRSENRSKADDSFSKTGNDSNWGAYEPAISSPITKSKQQNNEAVEKQTWGGFDSDDNETNTSCKLPNSSNSGDNKRIESQSSYSKWRAHNNSDNDSKNDNRAQNADHENTRSFEHIDSNNRGHNSSGKRWPCKYFKLGSCNHGDSCKFIHEAPTNAPETATKIPELCPFFEHQNCFQRSECLYMHEDFPCKLYHAGSRKCLAGDNCKYSHSSLTNESKSILEKYLGEKLADKTNLPYRENQNANITCNPMTPYGNMAVPPNFINGQMFMHPHAVPMMPMGFSNNGTPYGIPQLRPAYGMPPLTPAYWMPPQTSAYGMPPPTPAHGMPPPTPAYGMPPLTPAYNNNKDIDNLAKMIVGTKSENINSDIMEGFTVTNGSDTAMMYGGYAPQDTAMMDYMNRAAMLYLQNQLKTANHDQSWKIISLDVPGKIPYPLMKIDTTEMPHKYIDPRLRGHPSVRHSNEAIAEESIVIDADPYSPPANADNSFQYRSSDQESPILPVSVDAVSLLATESAAVNARVDRSYLQDPRFKRKKIPATPQKTTEERD